MPSPEVSELRERLVRSLVATLGPVLSAHRDEELYALALTTDSDVITVRLAAHTEEALASMGVAPEDLDHFRWWPDEWGISDEGVVPENGVESLVALSEELFDRHAAFPDHQLWVRQAREVLDQALGDERVRARLSAMNADWHPVLFVVDTDGDPGPTVRGIEVLNPGHPHPERVAAARRHFAED
ncbi:DUF4303 domain-containing protein [Streptomyces sp. NPDC005438]|uniref:DUF4303 domain-containing protein n=1 Tax=Streptomyces sp. NPDC005438 TaxID=3156880 RepID=UPI0033A65636